MKLLLILLGLVSFMVFSIDCLAISKSYKHLLKNWMENKAKEVCFGEENLSMKYEIIKRAEVFCTKKPAPELYIPILGGKSKNRIVQALINAEAQYVPPPQPDVQKNLNKYMIVRLLLEEIRRKNMLSRFSRDIDEEFNKQSLQMLMLNKLNKIENNMEESFGNISCIFNQLGFLDMENNLNLEGLNQFIDHGKYTAVESTDGIDRSWLKTKLKDINSMCVDYSNSLPNSIFKTVNLPSWITKLIYFDQCLQFYVTEACMQSDIRHKIAKKGISLQLVAQNAGITEEDLVSYMAMSYFGNKKKF